MKQMYKIKHECSLGHNFFPFMEKDEKKELVYSSWNNNLCTVNMCDCVGWITDERVENRKLKKIQS